MRSFKIGERVLRNGTDKSKFKYKVVAKRGWWIFSKYLIQHTVHDAYYVEAKHSELFKAPRYYK